MHTKITRMSIRNGPPLDCADLLMFVLPIFRYVRDGAVEAYRAHSGSTSGFQYHKQQGALGWLQREMRTETTPQVEELLLQEVDC
ncbi:hypothetical protein KUF71_018439 [Frankliniella fusca]|uniref:Uncharacterized protein n=1 Tax=Frankliniella fusca TaxID=407009 RepID=A0AAE1L5U5_9NEOP|nr:hypothetical protein KUF71_018439 [Frankliniella fusca]